MPTVNVQIGDIRRKGNNVHLVVTDLSSNKVVERTLNKDDINNWDDFASWLVNQDYDYELLPDKEKSLSITFHTETINVEGPTGEIISVTVRVVDGVIVA